ncbi:MAG: hypothetical protein ACKO2K_16675, partial [Alphaproteobacteria bacterium]
MERSNQAKVSEAVEVGGGAPAAAAGGAKGLHVQRRFTLPDEAALVAGKDRIDPFESEAWERRSAVISGEGGEVVFEQHDIEVPAAWSQLATNVVASKYFRGTPGTPERETSVKQLVGRVVRSIKRWGEEQGYFATPGDADVFADELTHLLVRQKASFNSPVWFNVGVEEKPQCSACFILSVRDTMDSILDWYRREGVIFKGASEQQAGAPPDRCGIPLQDHTAADAAAGDHAREQPQRQWAG